MKASELRIGNWVTHTADDRWSYRSPEKGPYVQFNFQWEDRDWFAYGNSLINIDLLKPIPFTEEWLIKIGFVRDYSFSLKHKNFTLYFDDGFFRLCVGLYCEEAKSLVHIKYVHQLQNLFFALTGEELQIKS